MNNPISKFSNYLKSRESLVLNDAFQNKMLVASSAINASLANRESFQFLWDAEVKVFSQWGEDGILNFLFDALGIVKPKIVEFGAGDFSECNSRFSVEYRNSSAYLVDLRKDLESKVMSLDVFWRSTIIPKIDFITPDSARVHLENAKKIFGGVDCVSLDIDGNDYWVLAALDFSKVSIVVCEYNPIYGAAGTYTISRDDNFDRRTAHFSWLHYGMSLQAAVMLMARQDFAFIGSNRVGNNAFFIRNSLIDKLSFKIPDTKNLEKFVDWRIRESRDENGELSFLNLEEAKLKIGMCELLDLNSNSIVKVSEII